MELFYLAAGCLLAAALGGLWVFRRFAQLPVFDRLVAALIPVSSAFLLIQAAVTVSQGPFWLWNDVRLARGIALTYGYKLYYDADGGPIIGTMHAPLGYVVYAWLGVLRNPTTALLAGCTVSALLVFGPMAWVLLRGSSPRIWRVALFVGCGLMAFRSAGLEYSAFRVHADAAALGFAAIAAGFLWRGNRERSSKDLMLSAAFAVLSVWSKQTLAPLMVALPAFVWMGEGFRQLYKYVICLAGAGVTISAVVLAAFWPPRPLWFNLFVVPGSQPRGEHENLARSVSQLGTENLLPVTVILFLVLHVFFEGRSTRRVREFLVEHRWLVFIFVAVALVPTFVAGELKVGGDANHMSLISYFVLLSAGTGLGAHISGNVEDKRTSAARILTAIFVLVGMLRMPLILFGMIGSPGLWTNPSQVAYTYEKAHPGMAYFPFHPLAVLLAGGKLYHSDIGLMDRELAGFGIGEEQFRRFVPEHFRIVAFPFDAPAPTKILAEQLQGFAKTHGTGELAGWIVYQRPER